MEKLIDPGDQFQVLVEPQYNKIWFRTVQDHKWPLLIKIYHRIKLNSKIDLCIGRSRINNRQTKIKSKINQDSKLQWPSVKDLAP